MRKSFKSVVAGVAALCVAGVISAVGATSASAAVAPFDPTVDVNYYGSVTFYDAAGHVVTSGDANNPLSAQYAVANANPGVVPAPRSIMSIAGPQLNVNPGLWGNGAPMNGSTIYPLATGPASVTSSPNPQGAMLATSISFKSEASAYVGYTTGPLANVFQVRLDQVGSPLYAATTITIDPVTGIWQQVSPTATDSTKTALTVSPASPVDTSASPTLTATVSRTAGMQAPLPAGNVQFFDGATSVGTSVVNASGVATLALTGLTVGTKSYNAVFTPTDPTVWITSSSSAVAYVVTAVKVSPTVGLTAGASAPFLGAADTFTATVTAPAAPGTIQFFDGATSLGAASAATTLTTSSLALGLHSITAQFVPTDAAAYNTVTSPVVSVNVLAVQLGACATTPANCTSTGTFTASVAAGSLVIHTMYDGLTPATTFNLGTLALNASATMLSTGPIAFGSANNGTGVTITDTRSGGLGWTANLQSGNFTVAGVPADVINARNLGFTKVATDYVSGNAINALTNPITMGDNAASSPAVAPGDITTLTGLAASKTFASIAPHTVAGVLVGGAGSVQVNGNMTLNAPTSTPAGTYSGTVTFTIA